MENSRKKILVTGASGFIGSHMVERLLGNNFEVHAILRSGVQAKNFGRIFDKINIHIADLADAETLSRIVGDIQPYGIYHFACSTIMSGRRAEDREVIGTNFVGSVNLINAASAVDYKFFINTGSFAEYGIKNFPAREADVCEPLELYAITKLSATLYAQAVGRTLGKPILTFRIFTPYGPKIQPGRLVHQVILSALESSPIDLSRPSVSRDLIYVEDIIDLYEEAAQKADDFKGEIFNAGGGKSVSIKELTDLVQAMCGSAVRLNWGAHGSPVYDSDFWQADMQKTFSHFDWRPKHSLEAGLEKTIEWFKHESKK